MDNELLAARIEDALTISSSKGKYKAVGFLNEEESAQAKSIVLNLNGRFCFCGGYDNALRVMFVALPDWAETVEWQNIITPVTLLCRKCERLTHRSVLGTLMSLGIGRETVGDILTEEGRTVLFLNKSVAKFVVEQLQKVGGIGVKAEYGFSQPLPEQGTLKQFAITVPSPRLDCAVSSFISVSREKAKLMIAEGLVFKGGIAEKKATFKVSEGDIISVRGYGRFIIDDLEGVTKKGRIVMKYSKYV